LASQVPRQQMQRLLVHGTSFDRVDGRGVLEAALQPFDQRALAGTDRSHQVENLSTLFPFQCRGMEITHDLSGGLLDPEELIGKEIIDPDRIVLEKTLYARVLGFENVMSARRQHNVVHASVAELGNIRILAYQIQILEERSAPGL